MKLNKNSNTAKIYRWFYGIESRYNLTNDGCEYFKKLALALVLFIPLGLITLPVTLITLFISKENLTPSNRLGYMVFLCLVCVGLLAMGCSVAMLFVNYNPKSFIFEFGIPGLFLWFIFIVIGIVEGVKALKNYIDERKIKYDENGYRIWDEPKQDNLLVAFYKAKKEKYCPKLEWYDKNK